MDSIELRAQLERYHRESFGWAMSCCLRDASEAESVLQAVYLKILEGKARFDGRAAFRTWLFSVIRKTAADERRRSILRGFRLSRYSRDATWTDRGKNPEDKLFQSELESL